MKLIHSKGFQQRIITGIVLAILIIFPFVVNQDIIFRVLFTFAGTMVIYEIWQSVRIRAASTMSVYIGSQFFASVQIGVLFSMVIVVFSLTKYELILMLVGAIATDVAAYFIGSLLHGKIFKSKPFPKTSPNKSWEGVVGGYLISVGAIIGTILIMRNCGIYSAFTNWDMAEAQEVNTLLLFQPSELFFIFTCPIVAIYGDYLASFTKRLLQIKDSNELVMETSPQIIKNFEQVMAGHGGYLDRLDSVIMVACYMFFIKAIT